MLLAFFPANCMIWQSPARLHRRPGSKTISAQGQIHDFYWRPSTSLFVLNDGNQPPLLLQSPTTLSRVTSTKHTVHVCNYKNQMITKVSDRKYRTWKLHGISRIAPSSSYKHAWYSRDKGGGGVEEGSQSSCPVVVCVTTHNDSTRASTWHRRHP